MTHNRWHALKLPPYLKLKSLDALLTRALRDDVGEGDVTTLATVPAEARTAAAFHVREAGIAAGLLVAERVFWLLDPSVVCWWMVMDGAPAQSGSVLGRISGSAHSLLMGERVALNLMQRMSGIATATHVLANAAHPVCVRDTRKTAPGLTLLDKWAVRLGGGHNHRLGLYDRFLIKDNHVAAAGGITHAIRRACRYRDHHAPSRVIEVEVRTMGELDAALELGGFDELLLDNMVTITDAGTVDTSLLEEAVGRVGQRYITEASGNITLQSAPWIAKTGVDFLSCGALTHSVKALDIGLTFSA